jgi:hypothetical protein
MTDHHRFEGSIVNRSNVTEIIGESWTRAAIAMGWKGPELPDPFSFFAERNLEEDQRSENFLQPWLTVSEFGACWLFDLHSVLGDDVLGPGDDLTKAKSPRLKAAWLFSGFLCAQLTAVRHLSRAGLGASAGVIVRTMVEAIRTSIILLDDNALALSFVGSTDCDAEKRLWRTQLSGREARRRFERALRRLPPELRTRILAWFSSNSEIYSSIVHPTFSSCIAACLPLDFDRSTRYTAVVGHVSLVDWQVLEQTSKVIWVLIKFISASLLGHLDGHDRVRSFSNESYLDSTVVLGYYAYSDVVLAFWDCDPPKLMPSTTRATSA